MFNVDPKTRQRVLLTPAELRAMLESDAPLTILAVQSVNPYTGTLSHSGQWIPGAIDVEAHFDFAAPGSPEQGQRPLPRIFDLQPRAAGGCGTIKQLSSTILSAP
jgi:thiosulfate/3-mercaptopyruvate sulfurtransferase